MPSGTGAARLASDRPASGSPALAKAKTGMMSQADHGLITCSSRIAGRAASASPAALSGMNDGEHHAGQRGVHARLQHRQPEQRAQQQVGRQRGARRSRFEDREAGDEERGEAPGPAGERWPV